MCSTQGYSSEMAGAKSQVFDRVQGFYTEYGLRGERDLSQRGKGKQVGLTAREPMGTTHRRDLGKDPMGHRGTKNFLELIRIKEGI